MDLAVSALDREVLDHDGSYLQIDGRRTPAWLIAHGADASAEAVLGLAAYVRAGGTSDARHALARLSDGISQLSGGNARQWPFGGVLPWALSRSDWHAWSSQMPAALATAADVLGDRSLARTAARDSFTFDPWMLTSGGPDNGRLPTRIDASQIAYGADSRRAVADRHRGSGGQPARRSRGGLVLRRQRLERPDLRPGHRRHLRRGLRGRHRQPELRCGVDHPRAADDARARRPPRGSVGSRRAPPCRRGSPRPSSRPRTAPCPATRASSPPRRLWTGESQFGGTGYASLRAGSTARFALGAHPDSLLMPVADLQPGSTGVDHLPGAGHRLGTRPVRAPSARRVTRPHRARCCR